jgi:hypothetical protein
MACSLMRIGPWRASGASVSAPGGRVAQARGRPGRPLRGQPRPRRAGTACMARLRHARTCGREARRDGRRGASPRGTELPEESQDGKAVYRGRRILRAKGSRLPWQSGGRGCERQRASASGAQGTGEPEDAKVSCPVRRGTGRKGSNDLARGLPYLVSHARFRRHRRSTASGSRRSIMPRLPTPRPAPHQQAGDTARRPPRRRLSASAASCRRYSRHLGYLAGALLTGYLG